MTFDEIPIRMLKLGVDRTWLCAQCDYSASTLASILAPKGTNRNQKALRRIWEALDREEDRQKAVPLVVAPLAHRVYIEPTTAQFDNWMAAAYSVPGRTFDEWAKDGLEKLAKEELGNAAKLSLVADAPGKSSPSTPANTVPTKYPGGRKVRQPRKNA